jgi:alkanesulfonate monooxygenase SsuD/methylene tetrahydromethanopterin reductase-like flavin-dependent oxidoreductase (luciferase family)
MTRLAGEVADVFVAHPTNASPRFLREVALPNLAKGAARAGRNPADVRVLACPFVATGATRDDVRAERERIREYLGFLYSTPQYAAALALYGLPGLERELQARIREGRWGELAAAIPDALLDALVPAAPYGEVAALLREEYGGLVAGVSFPVPADPADDALAAPAIAALRAAA